METVKSIELVTIHVDDIGIGLHFYQKHFGFEVKHQMDENSVWGKAGNAKIFLEGGNPSGEVKEKSIRSSVVFGVESATKFFNQLKADGITLLEEAPQDIGGEQLWFRFRDPSGNLLEIIGGH